MTSLKQIEANRLNARKSTGPRTEQGKQRSRQNALRHGLTAETVITRLENAADYQVFEATLYAEYQPRTATSRELVARLASVLWRLRRSTSIETGLLQIQGELMQGRNPTGSARNNRPLPEWYDEMDVAAANSPETNHPQASRSITLHDPVAVPQEFAYCFLQASRLQFGAFETLSRYETRAMAASGPADFYLTINDLSLRNALLSRGSLASFRKGNIFWLRVEFSTTKLVPQPRPVSIRVLIDSIAQIWRGFSCSKKPVNGLRVMTARKTEMTCRNGRA